MELIDKLKDISVSIEKNASHIKTEEATKTAFVMPFISALGYDIFNPLEVVPELTADVGTKKGERVDYAIMIDGKPIILMECKSIDADLNKIQSSQLYRYFSVTDARFGVLTNGIIYRFYTDIDEPNKMDERPFFEINLSNFSKYSVKELNKFTKSTFNLDTIIESASALKYTREIKKLISQQINEPNDEFIRFLAKTVYEGPVTQHVRDEFKDIIQTAFTQYINDVVNDRIESALKSGEEKKDDSKELEIKNDLTPTEDELEGLYITRAILSEFIDGSRVAIRNKMTYCSILLDNNNHKPLLRMHFKSNHKRLGFFDKQERDEHGGRIERITDVNGISDLYKYKDLIIKTVKAYENN